MLWAMSRAITLIKIVLRVISIIATHWDAIIKELRDDQVLIKQIVDEVRKLKVFEK